MKKSRFYIYGELDLSWKDQHFFELDLKDILFEDRDGVYDMIDELVSMELLKAYPKTIEIYTSDKMGISAIFTKGRKAYITSKIPLPRRSVGTLIASPEGDCDVNT